jgi:hypothetical protein
MTDITRRRGDTYADEFTIKSKKTRQPIDITGYTFLMTLDPSRSPVNSSSNIYQLDGVIVDAVNGRVEFAPSAPQADRIGKFFYDVQMIDGAGRKRTVVLAKYTYEQDITK